MHADDVRNCPAELLTLMWLQAQAQARLHQISEEPRDTIRRQAQMGFPTHEILQQNKERMVSGYALKHSLQRSEAFAAVTQGEGSRDWPPERQGRCKH